MLPTRFTVVLVLLSIGLIDDVGAQEVIKRKRRLPSNINWKETSTENYFIKYERELRPAVVARVKKELEEVLAVFVKEFRFKPATTTKKKSRKRKSKEKSSK